MNDEVRDSSHAITRGNRLMQAEVERASRNNESSATYSRFAEYMFWGATAVLATMSAAIFGAGLAPALLIGGGAVSLAAFGASVFLSRHAAHIDAHNQVLQSDIDSQQQSRRMVQAFARAQSNDVPFTHQSGRSWAESVGGQRAAGGNWQQRVLAQAAQEDAQTLTNLRS